MKGNTHDPFFMFFYIFTMFLTLQFSIKLISVLRVNFSPLVQKGTIGCHHHLPLTTHKEMAATVSLFVFLILFYFPMISHSLLFNQIDIHPHRCPLSLDFQREQSPTTIVCHSPQAKRRQCQ